MYRHASGMCDVTAGKVLSRVLTCTSRPMCLHQKSWKARSRSRKYNFARARAEKSKKRRNYIGRLYVRKHACMQTYWGGVLRYGTVVTALQVCINACMHACMHVCMHLCIYAFMHVCVRACARVFVRGFVCMHVSCCMFLYVCVYARAHWPISMPIHISACPVLGLKHIGHAVINYRYYRAIARWISTCFRVYGQTSPPTFQMFRRYLPRPHRHV